jgi:pSer/pThr/pTyr-binding forkhead associated (FHA) protein
VHSPDDDISLRVVKGPQVGERFFLEGDRITIGRDPEEQLFLSDITVSREHAIITREGAEVRVRDADSLNGTYLNGSIVEDALLKDGDILQIGTFQLRFCWGSGSGNSSC